MKARWGSGAAALGLIVLGALFGPSFAVAAPTIESTSVSNISSTGARLEARVNPHGASTAYRFEYGPADCAASACTQVPVSEGDAGSGSLPVTVSESIGGLPSGALFHFRVVAKSSGLEVEGPDRVFATWGPALAGLPDERAYEQASPTEKDGGDAQGRVAQIKASLDGRAITFSSTFGMPGGKGAQVLPLYLARREGEDQAAHWSTQGLLPPESAGQQAQILGWSPGFSEVFFQARKLGATASEGFLSQDTASGDPRLIGPYAQEAEYAYAGSSKDGSTVLFESRAKLDVAAGEAEPLAGHINLYAWNRESETLRLAGQMNTNSQSEAQLPSGAFAGSYNWGQGINNSGLRQGGGSRNYYLQDERAIAAEGSVYFTSVGTGRLYLRQNPGGPQSPLEGEGKCTDPALACTLAVSASEKTNGQGPGGADGAGPQPAAFQAASADGRTAFFTSPEKLTDDAKTGPEQPPAEISRANLDGSEPKADFIPGAHAVGVTVAGSHIYWADPLDGSIGRANLDGSGAEDHFIDPGPVSFEVKPGVFEEVESRPRYVALSEGHIYWTNTGRLNELERPADKGGTIGRAKINPGTEDAEEVEPACIRGASNPQGIAADSEHVYWANAAEDPTLRSIWRASLGCGEAKPLVEETSFGVVPYGVALGGGYLYFAANDAGDNGYVGRVALGGGAQEEFFAGKVATRGVAVQGAYLYWAAQREGEEAIGRLPIANFKGTSCETIAECETKFIEVQGAPEGLAADSVHLLWSLNGEAPGNPGNDLYRFEADAPAGERLTDLSVDHEAGDTNGAEVQGVLGTSRDGSRVYFAANGRLAAGAPAGDCHTVGGHGGLDSLSGECDLYLWEEGTITYLARLDASGGAAKSDGLDWAPTPKELFGNYAAKRAFASADGKTLLFSSQEKLSAYENEGVPELYRYRVGGGAIACVSCDPSGEAPTSGPSLGSVTFPNLLPRLAAAAVSSRNLSADGQRVFFESAEALSPKDTNGQVGCKATGSPSQGYPSCLDVYEWEAPSPGGSCEAGGPSYSPLDEGCVYLISTGKSPAPSLFADASESGDDVFFFTRQQLVGQDQDDLQDVYDARVGGGLESQNPQPGIVCKSTDACRPEEPGPPAVAGPTTPSFTGPQNPKPKRKTKPNKKHKKRHANHHKKKRRAHVERRAGR